MWHRSITEFPNLLIPFRVIPKICRHVLWCLTITAELSMRAGVPKKRQRTTTNESPCAMSGQISAKCLNKCKMGVCRCGELLWKRTQVAFIRFFPTLSSNFSSSSLAPFCSPCSSLATSFGGNSIVLQSQGENIGAEIAQIRFLFRNFVAKNTIWL